MRKVHDNSKENYYFWLHNSGKILNFYYILPWLRDVIATLSAAQGHKVSTDGAHTCV